LKIEESTQLAYDDDDDDDYIRLFRKMKGFRKYLTIVFECQSIMI